MVKKEKFIGIRVDETTWQVWNMLKEREKKYGKYMWFVFKEMLKIYLRSKGYWDLLRILDSKAVQL